jgi:hypothetical protein
MPEGLMGWRVRTRISKGRLGENGCGIRRLEWEICSRSFLLKETNCGEGKVIVHVGQSDFCIIRSEEDDEIFNIPKD